MRRDSRAPWHSRESSTFDTREKEFYLGLDTGEPARDTITRRAPAASDSRATHATRRRFLTARECVVALSVAAPPQAWHGALAAWTRRHGHARDDERLRRIAATIVTHRGVRSGESRECVVRGAMGPPRGAAPRASMGRPRARQRRANGTVRRRAPARRAEAARSRAPPPSGASQQYTPHRAVVEALPGEVTACLHRRRVAQTRAATLLGLSVCLGVRGPAAKAVAAWN